MPGDDTRLSGESDRRVGSSDQIQSSLPSSLRMLSRTSTIVCRRSSGSIVIMLVTNSTTS